jgi:hypothetical protein
MEKKSLVNPLKTTKKANVNSTAAKNEGKSTRKITTSRRAKMSKISFSFGASN